jgi:hypothetical protein
MFYIYIYIYSVHIYSVYTYIHIYIYIYIFVCVCVRVRACARRSDAPILVQMDHSRPLAYKCMNHIDVFIFYEGHVRYVDHVFAKCVCIHTKDLCLHTYKRSIGLYLELFFKPILLGRYMLQAILYCVCVYIYIYIYIYACVCVYVCIYVYIYIYISHTHCAGLRDFVRSGFDQASDADQHEQVSQGSQHIQVI